MAKYLNDVLIVVGLVLAVAGMWLVEPRLIVLFAGVLLMFIGIGRAGGRL